MKKQQITLALALALAGAAHAGEPTVGHAVAAASQLPYNCTAANSQEPTLLTAETGCYLMRVALTDLELSQADRTSFYLAGARLRQQELMLQELRAIRAKLTQLEGGAK